MPKVSFASRDAVESSVGLMEGDVEITHAACLAHQFQQSKSGRQAPPSCDVVLTMIRTDAQSDSPDWVNEPVMKYYSLGANSLERYHPGEAKGRDDQEPRDLGDSMDTVGNCIFNVDGSALNKKCKWVTFVIALEKCGFKPDILAAGYLPDLVGLRGHVVTETIKLNSKGLTDRDPTVLVFDKITQFPYNLKAQPAVAHGLVSQPRVRPAAAAADNGGFQAAVDAAINALAQLNEHFLGKKGVDIRLVRSVFGTKLVQARADAATQKAAHELFKDQGWLEGQAAIFDWTIEGDKISFP